MRGYIAFTKKEMLEYLRSYKLFVMGMIFLVLGFMNPVTAKYTPLIIEKFLPEGMSITIAEPGILDSWMQFFKNVPLIGLIVLLILISTSFSGEFSKGTLIPVVTKGLSRTSVLCAKATAAVLHWTFFYYMSAAVTYVYSLMFWTEAGAPDLWVSISLVWVFGIVLIGLALLGGIIFGNASGAILMTGSIMLLMVILNILPVLQKYNPLRLISENMNLLNQQAGCVDFIPALLVSLLLILGSFVISMIIFRKKHI